mgnify:CR=1 FL=1
MLSLYTFENFLRFQLQDKHNASFFSNMSWRGTPQSKCKSNKKAAIITYLVVDLFACLNGIGGFYSFIPLPFRCGITGCRMLCRSFSNCSLNHSPMGRKSTVRMNLPLSENTLALTSFAMNFRLCSSEYNSPLYSMGLPVSNVAVCSLLKPTARHNLSMLIISLICGNHFKVLFNNTVSREISRLRFVSVCANSLIYFCCISNSWRLWSACMVCILSCRASMASPCVATSRCRAVFSLSSVLTLLLPKREPTLSAMLAAAVVAAPFSFSVCISSHKMRP